MLEATAPVARPGDARGDGAGRAASLRGDRVAPRRISARSNGGCSSPRARAAINGWSRSRRGSSPASPATWMSNVPPTATTDRVFVVLKGARRGRAVEHRRARGDRAGAPRPRGGLAHATCHELRHTCLTRLREAGMALEAIQAQAGHRSIESTRIYLHLANDWLAGEYARAVALLIDATAGGDLMTARRVLSPRTRTRAGTRDWEPLSQQAPQLALTAWALSRPDGPVVCDPAPSSPPTSPCEASPGSSSSHGVDRVRRRSSVATSRATSTGWRAPAPSKGRAPARNTIRQRLGMVRAFFDRIIEWGWADAPTRTPIVRHRRARRRRPAAPQFLDDAQAARLMAAAANGRRRWIGSSSSCWPAPDYGPGELCDLDADAIGQITGAWWLRVPVGKLRNDRYVPLHPTLVELLAAWTARTPATPRARRPTAWTATASGASCAASPAPPASAMSTPTSSDTPSPPKPSTEACASRPSPRCSATAACA